MSNKEKCSACMTVPEDVMVLSCAHCICLLCAFDEVRRQEKTINYNICCHKCQEVTEIDDGLYKQLMQLMGTHPLIIKKQQNMLNRQSIIRQERRMVPQGFDSDLQRTCNWHPEYAIMYVCKTCNDTFICPECLINGCHKNHDSNAIQKQGQKIKGKLQHDLTKVNQKIEELQKMQQTRVFSIQQRRRQLEKLRNTAKIQYESIKQAILRQEATVIAKCNELIAAHQKQEEAFKHDIAHQIKMYEDQRIDLIDLLNPLMQQSIMGQSRALQKMMMVNLVESYKKFTKVAQRDRENYIKIAQEKMEEDIQIIQSLTKKIDRISLNNFYHHKQQIPHEIPKQTSPIAIRKYNYPKFQKYAINPQQTLQARPISSNYPPMKPQNHSKNNDLFKLL